MAFFAIMEGFPVYVCPINKNNRVTIIFCYASLINWIEQWLTDRRQRVVVDGEVSIWKSVLRGVPQGSVLGHNILLVYINDLDEDPLLTSYTRIETLTV